MQLGKLASYFENNMKEKFDLQEEENNRVDELISKMSDMGLDPTTKANLLVRRNR